LVLVPLAAACNEQAAAPLPRRSEGVAAKSASAPPTATATAAATKPARKPRTLCTAKPEGKTPDAAIATAHAKGAEPPPDPIPFGKGRWTWVNLWAAWCGPCKEEMPRLLGWQKKLAGEGVKLDFAFVSLDDDQRQMQRFLDKQPDGGVRQSYWLADDAKRKAWLEPMGIGLDVTLPVHALVAPDGELRCVIHGALEDVDYPSVQAVLKKSGS
jgi:thiol-disulfide isomerase/thioredoxin